MKELTQTEMQQVNGGIVPAVILAGKVIGTVGGTAGLLSWAYFTFK